MATGVAPARIFVKRTTLAIQGGRSKVGDG